MSDTIDCPSCAHEHTPSGIHEDDSGDHVCEACGFEFKVVIDYDPSYSARCKTHTFGEPRHVDLLGDLRVCEKCGYTKLEETT